MKAPPIGHNSRRITLDIAIEENRRRGLLLSQRDVLIKMSRDPRVKMKHMRVVAEVIEHTNGQTGLAYPGRKRLAEVTGYFIMDVLKDEAGPYSESTVAKVISDLIMWGYLVSEKRALPGSGRAIAHYAIAIPTIEDLQAEITAYVERIRNRGKVGPPNIQGHLELPPPDVPPYGNNADVPTVGTVPTGVKVTNSDFPTGGKVVTSDVPPYGNNADVPTGGNVPTGNPANVPTGDPANVPTGDPTVTSKGELEKGTRYTPPTPSRSERVCVDGPTHLGHGVTFDGETIRHPKFAINIPSIELRVFAHPSITKDMIVAAAKAAALQWAVELENGGFFDRVVPGNVAGVIVGTLMRTLRNSEAHKAQLDKQRGPPTQGHRGRVRFSTGEKS
jgi:hypothetical protein